MYELTRNPDFVRRTADGANIPVNIPLNSDCDAYQKWVAAGNVPSHPMADLIKYANDVQWAKAISGVVRIEVDGVLVPFLTTQASMSLLNGKILAMTMPDGPAMANWQVGPTEFMAIPKPALIEAGRAVEAYVQSTFDKLPAIFAGIADGSIATPAAINDAFNQ